MFPKFKIVVPPNHPILIGFSNINHPFWGFYPYFWKHPNGFGEKPPPSLDLPKTTFKGDIFLFPELFCPPKRKRFGSGEIPFLFQGNLAWWTYHSIWPECKVCLHYDLPITCTMRISQMWVYIYLAYMILAILARSWSWCQLIFVPISMATSGTSWFTLGIFGWKESPPK